MGCGGSKGQAPAKNDNPPIAEIEVPDIDPGYPAPAPPKTKKDDFYKPSDYTAIDNRVKQQFARQIPGSFEELVAALDTMCKNDLERLRAIFMWLYHQNIHGNFYSGVTDPHTPKGYMKLIKTKNGSYASFFALLCRAADIPCNVIRGSGRGDEYHVGQTEMAGLDSAWCAVYVDGNWRLVHPLWAYFNEKQNYMQGKRPPAGTKRTAPNEFFYLIDPNKMVCFCLPSNAPWQLLKTKWDAKKFINSPQFTEQYFTSGLMLPKKYNAVIEAENGVCVIEFDHQPHEELSIDADVTFVESLDSDGTGNEGRPPEMRMSEYIATSSASTSKTVVVKCPSSGHYKADIYGGSDPSKPKVVEFRIDSSAGGKPHQPFPLQPKEGFGLLAGPASNLGISDVDPDSGIVLCKAKQTKQFSFTTTQSLDTEAKLIHNALTVSDLQGFVTCQMTPNKGQVKVVVPEASNLEFGLEITARPAGTSKPFVVVANYLLVDENWRKKTAVISPRKTVNKEGVREALIDATNKSDILRLERAIDEFQRAGLSDDGDLTRARERLVELHKRNLREATLGRKLEPLDDAIEAAKRSQVKEELIYSQEMMDAEKVRRQLRRLKLYMHKVLALNKATISEIHRYHRPRPLVHNVMQATFRILGEPQNKVKEWSYVQSCMRQLGRNSMLARVQRFDPVQMRDRQVQDAEGHLAQTNKYLVRMCSAGAGTFYVWSNNMISEYQGKGQTDPLEIWQGNSKSSSLSPRGKMPAENGFNASSPTRKGVRSGLQEDGMNASRLSTNRERLPPVNESRQSGQRMTPEAPTGRDNDYGPRSITPLSGRGGQGRYSPRQSNRGVDEWNPNAYTRPSGVWSGDGVSLDDWDPNGPYTSNRNERYG